MRLSPPRKINWSIAILFGLISLLLHQGIIPLETFPGLDYWLMTIAFLILAIATLFRGL
ncbi:MAG TPA: hypothetical protein G4O11_00075 [Anaerolineae bacterium]|nr:hypothetical protein [Anaerolineae bacterium]